MNVLHTNKLLQVDHDLTVTAVDFEVGGGEETAHWIRLALPLPIALKAGATYILRYTSDDTGSYPVKATITEKPATAEGAE